MNIHITAKGTVHSEDPKNYTYNYHCDTHEEQDNPIKLVEQQGHNYPQTYTFHHVVSVELDTLDEDLYTDALEKHLNTYFKKAMPKDQEIPSIDAIIKKQLSSPYYYTLSIHTISEEEGEDFEAQLQAVQQDVQEFLHAKLPARSNPIQKNTHQPSQVTTTVVNYHQQRHEQPSFTQPLHPRTLLTMSRKNIDALLHDLITAGKKPSHLITMTHFHTPKRITPMHLMIYLGNELSSLAYPEYNQERRTPEENLMMCRTALKNLDSMLASSHLTNPELTAFISTVKKHVQALTYAFDAHVHSITSDNQDNQDTSIEHRHGL